MTRVMIVAGPRTSRIFPVILSLLPVGEVEPSRREPRRWLFDHPLTGRDRRSDSTPDQGFCQTRPWDGPRAPGRLFESWIRRWRQQGHYQAHEEVRDRVA